MDPAQKAVKKADGQRRRTMLKPVQIPATIAANPMRADAVDV